MTGFQEFSLALPEALWAFVAMPFLVALFFAAEKRRRAALNAFISLRLQPRLAGAASPSRRRWSFTFLLLSLCLGILALARPRWGFSWEEQTSQGRDVIIAIDTSRSMLAQDLKPNRLARAKLAAQDLLSLLDGDRVGLIAFAGTSFLQAPLTADYDAVRDALAELDTEIIPRGGTNLTAAIEEAAEAFGKGESEHRALIIFTDGEELEADAVEAAKDASVKFRLFTVGLGSPEGEVIPLLNERGGTDFVRDEQGNYVRSRLDEGRLREIAEAAGGFYVHLQGGLGEMQQIVRDGLGKMKEREAESRFTKQPIERYHWPLAGSVFCAIAGLLIGDRRRLAQKSSSPVSAAAAIMLALGLAPTLQAAPEAEFNRGCDAFKSGNYTTAAQAFGAALGSGDVSLQKRSAYNLANTLARRGAQHEKKEEKLTEWKNALQHYDRALELDPDHADARHNRDLVKKAIAELEKPQQEQQQQKNEKSEDQKDKSGEQDEQKEDGSKPQEDQSKGGDKEQEQKSSSGSGEQKDQQKKEAGQQKEQNGQKDGEKQPGKQGEQKEQNGEPKPGDGQKQPQPKPGDKPQQPPQRPEPGKDQPPEKGELKGANPQSSDPQNEPPKGDAAEEAAAAADGRMTEKQAKTLLEAIKDERVRLLNPRDLEEQWKPRNFKNW